MKKVFFGLAVAAVALSASAFTSADAKLANELVGQIAPGQFKLINPAERGVTWDCIQGETACTATLKNGVVADPSTTYTTSQVNLSPITDEQFILY